MQRYRCQICHKMFQSKRRIKAKQSKLWNEYVWKKQNLNDLSQKTKHSHVWVRKQLDAVVLPTQNLIPHPVVIATDTTFWGRHYGVCVFRIPNEKENIWWNEVSSEKMIHYQYGRERYWKRKGGPFWGLWWTADVA